MPSRATSSRKAARIHLAFWMAYFALFWGRSFRLDGAGDLVSGHPHLWADWAIHFTLGNAMAQRELIPIANPLLRGEPLAYPFAADLVSALLMRSGVPMVSAFVLPSLLWSWLLVFALFHVLRALFRSEGVAIAGSWLFLCGGGLGFLAFLRDAAASAHPLLALVNPAHEYTRLGGSSIVLLSVIDGMVIPQRSFTLGFPLALFALGLVHAALRDPRPGGPTRRSWIELLGASLILGLMPVIHPHSLLAAFVVLGCWSVGRLLEDRSGSWPRRIEPWAIVAVATSALALPLIARFLAGQVGGAFVRWFPGWYAKELHANWAWFWLQNWSATPLLATAGLALLLRRRDGSGSRLGALFTFLPFFLIFALVNLFVFAPWIFDNTKLLAWAAVGFSGLAAHALASLWRAAEPQLQGGSPTACRGARRAAVWSLRSMAAVLFLASTASGAIDAYRVLRVDLHQDVMYSAEALALGRWAREHTPPDSTWLTSDQHNHWLINLTGRQTIMAYRGWLWSQGYRYRDAERDVGRMLESADAGLLAQYGIDYVVIGPDEKASWHATERAFERFPVVARTRSYAVFKVR
jgi:hypothetical protein